MKTLDKKMHFSPRVLVGFVLAGTSVGAWAQTTSASDNANALDEVVVTATKRAETLQDVPISVGVVSGATVEKFGLMGFEDLQNHVPNLLVQETLGSYQVRIRGLGSGAGQLSFVSAVGNFVDGVYCGRPRCFQEPLFDVERVEVVRGPQGALFGKNTIAGAISMTSARPTDEFEGKISAGTELSEGGYNVSGYLSGPLSDTLGVRLAFKREDLDGFIKNITTGKEENAIETMLVRGTLQWKPSENFSLVVKAEKGQKDIDGYTVQSIALGGYGTPRPFSQPERLDDETSTRSIFPEGQFDGTDTGSYLLNMDWNIGEYTLTSITGLQEFDFLRRSSATAYTELFVDTQISEDYEQKSQEFRLTSPKGEFFDFVAGLYYSEDDSRIRQFSPFVTATAGLYSTSIRDYVGGSESKSAYFSGTFHFAGDRARATVGLRYGEDDLNGNAWATHASFTSATNALTPVPTDLTYPLPGAGYSPFNPATGGGTPEFNFISDRKEDYFDPSVNLQFDVNDDIMVYASYAKGFKAGGFIANDGTLGGQILQRIVLTTPGGAAGYAAGATSTFAQTYAGVNTLTVAQLAAASTLQQPIRLQPHNGVFDFQPEEAKSVELGAKMKFLDGAIRWNIALFKTDFTNLQTSQFDGVRFITRNAASAISRGIESEFDWRINRNFTLSLDAAYLDAYYDRYTNTFCKVITIQGTLADPLCTTTNGRGNLSGEQLERAPKFEATLSANWESNLTEKLRLRINGSIYHSDDYYIQANVSPLYVQPAFQKYDLRVAVAQAEDKWEVALVGRNLSDELTIQHAFQVGVYHAASVSTPRYLTLQGTWRF